MTFISYLYARVSKAIYVRGAQGENVLAKPDPEGWIRYMETTRRSDYAQHREEYDRNAERAIALYRQRVAAGVSPILAYDCSGLIMEYALEYGIADKDLTAAGIYQQKCNAIEGPATIRGQLVFKSKSTPGSITHVGVYVEGEYVIEAKGRDDGVVISPYRAAEWKYVGEWPALMRCCCTVDAITDIAPDTEIIEYLQAVLNGCGYGDADGHPLDVDGKLGKKTLAALDALIRANMPELKLIPDRVPGSPGWYRAEK